MTTYQTAPSYSGESSSKEQSWSQAPTPNPSDVGSAVHTLLSSTKRLQEVLRLWSHGKATEVDVSDMYVRIGHEFNATISAFAYYQIDLSDIHTIPTELRVVLERCLSEEPSPDVLENFMPDLRRVLYKLLKGLQSRQDTWREAMQHSASGGPAVDSR